MSTRRRTAVARHKQATPVRDPVRYEAEQATGMRQRGALVAYAEVKAGATPLTWPEARAHLAKGQIHVEAAGAGSYRSVLELLGFKEIECTDSTSSAGRWNGTCESKDGGAYEWSQEPDHPYHGYAYSVMAV